MQIIKQYIDTLLFNQKFWKTLAIDALFFALFLAALIWLGSSIEAKGQELKNILPGQETASPEQLLPVVKELKYFLLYSIFIGALVLLISFFAYSYSRMLIYYELFAKKQAKKTFWKWSGLNLILLLLLLAYSAASLLILFILSFFFDPIQNPAVKAILNNLITAVLQLFFILFLFSAYNYFTLNPKIGVSIKQAFQLFKNKKFTKIFIFSLITVAIIYFIRWGLREIILDKISIVYTWAETLTDLIFVLLLFSWLRLLLLKYHEHS